MALMRKKLCLGLSVSSISVSVTLAGSQTVDRDFMLVSQVLSTCLLSFLLPQAQLVPKSLITLFLVHAAVSRPGVIVGVIDLY